jgi:hypothetical protein
VWFWFVNFIPNPDADFIFQQNDYIAIIGFPENIKVFKESMTMGADLNSGIL